MPVKRKIVKRNRRKTNLLSRKIKVFAFALITIVLSLICVVSFGVYQFIHAPFTKASNVSVSDDIWSDGRSTIMTVLVEDINDPYSEITDLKIVSLDDKSKKYQIYDIPVNEMVDYALNYGQGPLSRLYGVGNADQNRGIYAIQKTLFKLLAVNIDSYIILDEKTFNSINSDLDGIDREDVSESLRLKNAYKIPAVIGKIRDKSITNIKISDIFKLISFIRETSSTSSSYIEINKYQLLDGTLWDAVWQSNATTSNVNKENIKVFIANASTDPKIPGLAKWGSRVTKNLGADVLEEENSFIEFEGNVIITNNIELETVKALAKAFGITNIILRDDLDRSAGYNPHIFRTDVSLILKSF